MVNSEPENQSNTANLDTSPTQTKTRILSIDVFRGLTITFMVFVNSVGGFPNTPWWSRHVTDYGLTYVDLVAPFFVFAIGLTYHISYIRGLQKEGGLNTFFRFLRRYAAFIGIGFIGGSYHFYAEGILFGWNVLQSIGLAGIFTLLFIRFSRYWRLIIAILFTIVYQIVLNLPLVVGDTEMTISDYNLIDVHGGFIGAFGYGLIMLYSTVVSDAIQTRKMEEFLISGVVFTVLGVMTHVLWGISKERMTVPYVFISVGIACLCFYTLWVVYDKYEWSKQTSRFFQPQGKNSFFLYILHGLIIGDMWLILNESSPFAFILLVAVLNVIVIWQIAAYMDKKKKYVVF
jgi:predicted acyltransferase